MSDNKLNYIQIGGLTYDIGGSGSSAGGYPVVTVENDFNIEAQPNTFYNIRNAEDSEVNISFKDEEFYIKDLSRHIFFTCVAPEGFEEIGQIFSMVGGRVSASDRPEFKYQMNLGIGLELIIVYFSDEIKTGDSVTAMLTMPGTEAPAMELLLNDIVVLNEDIPNIMYIVTEGIRLPFAVSEIENDNSSYNHKYLAIGHILVLTGGDVLYSKEPLSLASAFYNADGEEFVLSDLDASIVEQNNSEIISSKVANEFVFSLNTPCDNVVFDKQVQWNNYNIPDTSKVGTITISIVNGVACYTFV